MVFTTAEKKRVLELLDAPTVPIPVRKNHGLGPVVDTDVLYPIGGEDALRELWEYRAPVYAGKIERIELLYIRRGEGALKVRPGWHYCVKDSICICELYPSTREEIGKFENLRKWVEAELEKRVTLLTKEEFAQYPFSQHFVWIDGLTETKVFTLRPEDFEDSNLEDHISGKTVQHYVFAEGRLIKLEGKPSTADYIGGKIVKTTGDTLEQMLRAKGIEKESVEYIVYTIDVPYTPTDDFTEDAVVVPAACIGIEARAYHDTPDSR